MARRQKAAQAEEKGKLRIGDMWNAITIIALSQNNPMKALAELVENSIDAHARNIVIVRGREGGRAFLRISDDGDGIPRDEVGLPDFKFVATHICDSIKRRMREQGAEGIQGEFGIGLLSFWTLGKELVITSAGADEHTYEMHLAKEHPGYTVRRRRLLFPARGTEVSVAPLLPGIRQLSGEKIQWYLASELRDRIKSSGVKIEVVDRQARRQFTVEPRQFTGRLLHDLPAVTTPLGDVYVELYLADQGVENTVGLSRSGTRVLKSLTALDDFAAEPWTSGCLEGIVDAPFLRLTPGTRDGVIHDEAYLEFARAMEPVAERLKSLIEEQREAEEQRASRRILKSVQKAIRDALLALPADEYDWFDVRAGVKRSGAAAATSAGAAAAAGDGESAASGAGAEEDSGEEAVVEPSQKQFFEYEGPLHSVRVSPASAVVPVGGQKSFRAIPRDRRGRLVERDLEYVWRVAEGEGTLPNATGECATFVAPAEPGLTRIEVAARQAGCECRGEALVTVTDSLEVEGAKAGRENRKGLPGYTFHRAPGELWRSRYDADRNIVVINNGHRDFVFAARNASRKLRYICRLFTKELVLRNFPGIPAPSLLERMVELSLYTEENLR